ncbi:transporter substrate-binding domain-containing protein [Amycolatopsis sp. NPDC005232]|uniref:transporter substrate-binding domain-containing protein n=1 Tax=Amycolatopsis sp. NPDC005232 TaxID=3157027 RepID=UPI0033B9A1E2
MKKLVLSLAAGVAVATALSGCSNTDTPVGAPAGSAAASQPAAAAVAPAAVDPAVKALVPADIAAAGTINGGANFQAAPMAMYETGTKTPTGAVVKLVEHAAGMMGLKVAWQQVLYPDQLPAMQAGKIVVSGSASAANADIMAKANVVGAFKNLQGILATADKASQFETLDAVCGKKIGLGKAAAATVAIFNDIVKHCTQGGKPAPQMVGLSATADIVLAVQSGRVDGGMIPTPTVVYTAQQSQGKLVATKANDAIAEQIDEGDEGFTIAKNQPKLAAAFQAAVNAMIKDGSYAKILTGFGLPQNQLVPTATLNQATK